MNNKFNQDKLKSQSKREIYTIILDLRLVIRNLVMKLLSKYQHQEATDYISYMKAVMY